MILVVGHVPKEHPSCVMARDSGTQPDEEITLTGRWEWVSQATVYKGITSEENSLAHAGCAQHTHTTHSWGTISLD